MFKWFSIITAAAAFSAATAAPAQAAVVTAPVAMTFNGALQPAYHNTAISLTGRARHGTTANTVPGQMWFAPTTTAPILISTTHGTARGDVATTVTARTSSAWKAAYRGNTTRAAATRTDTADVDITATTSTIWTAIYGVTSIGYGGEPWTSAAITIPTPTFRVDYHITCYALEGASVSLAWAGKVLLTTPKLTYNAESESFEATASIKASGGAKHSAFSMNNPEGSRCYTDFKVFYPKQRTKTKHVTV